MRNVKILIAEDDPLTRQGLAEILLAEGYEVVQAADGQEAVERFTAEPPDLVCLDVMMPRMNGYDVCRRIRAENDRVPVVFISAKSEEIDTVLGLELGADDFLVKPFGVKEVVARVRAVLRRCRDPQTATAKSFWLGDLQVFPAQLRARRDDQTLELTARDVKLLQLFHDRQGQVLDRNTLFNHCWGEDYFPNSRTLDQHISQLRKRIETNPKAPRLICTVHGVGYRYDG